MWQTNIPSRFLDELPEAHVAVTESQGGFTERAGYGGYGGGSRFDEMKSFGSSYGTPGWQRAQANKGRGGFSESGAPRYGQQGVGDDSLDHIDPIYDDDGLVVRRPEAAYGDPIFGGGRWQAILDPVECVGPAPTPPYLPEQRPSQLSSVVAGAFAKRRVWCATVEPTVRYRPVTANHPLAPGPTRIAVDTATGVCVYSHVLRGPYAGQGHRLVIEAVDEYQLDDLFTQQDFNLTDVSRHVPWPVLPA